MSTSEIVPDKIDRRRGPRSAEVKAAIAASQNRWWASLTPEQQQARRERCARVGRSNKGRPGIRSPKSESTKLKLRAAHKGRAPQQETTRMGLLARQITGAVYSAATIDKWNLAPANDRRAAARLLAECGRL